VKGKITSKADRAIRSPGPCNRNTCTLYSFHYSKVGNTHEFIKARI